MRSISTVTGWHDTKDKTVTEEERLQKLMEIVSRIPATWTCVKCNREFSNAPSSEDIPYAFEVNTDKNGHRTQGGDICKDCYNSAGQ